MHRIVVIDDDQDVREVMSAVLESAGYDVASARDGARGLALLREHAADLVITDIFMPEAEGLETIRQMRREFPQVAIIAMSGGGDLLEPRSYLQLAHQFGARLTLTKPFRGAALLRAVHDLLHPESPAQE